MSSKIAFLLGLAAVVIGGLMGGLAVWPMKVVKHYRFEHLWFVAMTTGLLIFPWAATLLFCPRALIAYGTVPLNTLFTANLCSLGWGIANVLCGLCYVRIGMALTVSIITGLGAATGVVLPMVVKGSGVFRNASDLDSLAGLAALAGVCLMGFALVFASQAGAGRDRGPGTSDANKHRFAIGLLMAFIAGLLSAGMCLSFVYSQGPITEAFRREGVGQFTADLAVWPASLLGGALVAVLYPAWLITSSGTWRVLTVSRDELLMSVMMGATGYLATFLTGVGMKALGSLGGAVGSGIQLSAWMAGGLILGFAAGEWRGVPTALRRKLYWAIVCLILAIAIMTYANYLAKSTA